MAGRDSGVEAPRVSTSAPTSTDARGNSMFARTGRFPARLLVPGTGRFPRRLLVPGTGRLLRRSVPGIAPTGAADTKDARVAVAKKNMVRIEGIFLFQTNVRGRTVGFLRCKF